MLDTFHPETNDSLQIPEPKPIVSYIIQFWPWALYYKKKKWITNKAIKVKRKVEYARPQKL